MSKKLMFLSKGSKSNHSTRGIDLGSSLKKLEVSDNNSNKKNTYHKVSKGNKEVVSKSTKSNKELRRSLRYKRAAKKFNQRLIGGLGRQTETNTIETNF